MLFGYEFAISYHATSMMKDVDGLRRHIDIIIHRYLVQANRMRVNDVTLRPFAYSYDSFNICSTLGVRSDYKTVIWYTKLVIWSLFVHIYCYMVTLKCMKMSYGHYVHTYGHFSKVI